MGILPIYCHPPGRNGSIYRWVSIFSFSFGFLEAIVVVYLRLTYYPEGFFFPLNPEAVKIYPVEVVREIATICMLVSVGMVAGKNATQRLAWFLFSFGVWDISFYAALKIMLNWPSSLLTWDILFLIPVVWSGPVLAPLVCSFTMIFFALVVIESGSPSGNRSVSITGVEWAMLGIGSMLVFFTFIRDYSFILIRNGFFSANRLSGVGMAMTELFDFVPESYDWALFFAGESVVIAAIVILALRNRKFRIRK